MFNRRQFLKSATSASIVATQLGSAVASDTCRKQNSIGHRACCKRPDAILIKGHLGTQMMRNALVASGKIPEGSAGDNKNGGPYWPEVERMCNKLYDFGFAPSTHSPTTYRRIGDVIRSSVIKKQMSHPLTVIGYSVGADAAIDVAHQLKTDGIRVDALILIETTLGVRRIPANVSHCLNLYCPKPLTDWLVVARGVKVRAQSKQTELTNINWGTDKRFRQLREFEQYNHMNIADCPEIQDFVVSYAAMRIDSFLNKSGRSA